MCFPLDDVIDKVIVQRQGKKGKFGGVICRCIFLIIVDKKPCQNFCYLV